LAYNDFDLKTAIETFSLTEDRDADLFSEVAPIEPSPSLRDLLEEFAPVALATNTEKARSEFIIVPFLIEWKRRSRSSLNILSGIALDVDRSRGLTGFCDYLISRSDGYHYLKAPLIAVVEAKREDVYGGFGQCVAEMVAIRLFNERDQVSLPVIYGCVTSGNIWRFLKLEGSALTIDKPEYYLGDPGKLLGVLVHISAG